jgi:hypothetical protein
VYFGIRIWIIRTCSGARVTSVFLSDGSADQNLIEVVCVRVRWNVCQKNVLLSSVTKKKVGPTVEKHM